MNEHDIEPFVLVPRHEHSHTITPQLKVHASIFDITNTIEAKVSISFAQKDGPDRDTLRWGIRYGQIKLADIIHKAGDR